MKKLVFALVLALLCILLLEGAGMVGLRVLNGQWISPGDVVADLAGASDDADRADLKQHIVAKRRLPTYLQQHILHPYFGFVRNPDVPEHEFVERTVPYPVNEFGFFGPSPLVKRNPERIRVLLTGGSVALEFFIDAKDHFEELLEALPPLAGKEVDLICLALGGLKQPQQVLILNYLLSIGSEPDVVLALDGFNEVVLPAVENIPNGVYPYFPRKWNVYGSTSLDMEAAVHAGTIARRREEVDASKQFIRGSVLRKSRVGVALWQSAHRKKAIRRTESEQALQALLENRKERLPPQLTGPAIEPMTREQMADSLVAVWIRSSRQMWELCRAHGIPFVQFLQPNQYVPGTKVFTAWEKENAIASEKYVWRIAATYGYPVLMARGAELAAMGVPYVDLTDIYVDVTETIYKDICCHVNQHGAELLAERMAAELAVVMEAD